MAAFELALRQGAEGIELDVHLSSDGVPMVIHDPRLSRTTSGSGWVSEHRANALRRLDAGSWFNRRFPEKARHRYVGAKIPLLSEVLAWVRQHKILAFVEIKGGRNAYPGIEAKVLDEIERAGVQRLATIISFDLATLRRVRELDSRISLGLDVSRSLLAIRRVRSLAGRASFPIGLSHHGDLSAAHTSIRFVFLPGPWTSRRGWNEESLTVWTESSRTTRPGLRKSLAGNESSDRQRPEARSQKSGDRRWVVDGM